MQDKEINKLTYFIQLALFYCGIRHMLHVHQFIHQYQAFFSSTGILEQTLIKIWEIHIVKIVNFGKNKLPYFDIACLLIR